MPKVEFTVKSEIDRTVRVKQLEGMFDVPAHEKLEQRWSGNVPLDDRPWNVGLIVGASGCGKSSVMRQLFGEPKTYAWTAKSLIDDFPAGTPIQAITEVCSAVGFNTIPSWMKPHAVLSNGEKFRADLARHLMETPDPIVVDEFTSVVDRQVAQIASHAVQKYIRKHSKKFVAVSCHYDIEDWLQPDWVLEPATMTFNWRSVQRRPSIPVEIVRADYSAWRLFSSFHYMSNQLHRAAKCFVLKVDGAPAAFLAIMHRPHPKVENIKGVSRIVTLPDYQGLGLGHVLTDHVGSMLKTLGYRLHHYPAHPALIRALDRSKNWALHTKPGFKNNKAKATNKESLDFGGRPNAVFMYAGPTHEDRAFAKQFLELHDISRQRVAA